MKIAPRTAPRGVRIAGTGSHTPPAVLTNDDLAAMMDTNDEWIQQRTGIQRRHICDPNSESTITMARAAVEKALEAEDIDPATLDFVLVGTVTPEMACPSTAARLAGQIGATPAGACDISAACCGFMYSLNMADSLIRAGRADRIAVVGADTMSSIVDYEERTCSILFGDAAGAAILEATEDPDRGSVYQTMHADGEGWPALYIPRHEEQLPEGADPDFIKMGCLRMNGREVYKFAVSRFQTAIKDALEATELKPEDVGAYICHQSNARIIESAIDKLGLPPEKVFINIDEYGNTAAGSVGLCLDEMFRKNLIDESKPTLMVAFGGGMTWASSVWRH